MPRGYWKDKDHQRKFFDTLATQLNIKTHEDWYKIPAETVYSKGGSWAHHEYGTLLEGVYLL
jgi:hypothetical protein